MINQDKLDMLVGQRINVYDAHFSINGVLYTTDYETFKVETEAEGSFAEVSFTVNDIKELDSFVNSINLK